MDPMIVILWIGVIVFGVTSVIALLYLVGVLQGPHRKLLIGVLITQIIVAGVGAFTYQLKKFERDVRLPVLGLMIVEQAPRSVIYDGTLPIYLRSPDVSRAQRFADLVVDLREDFTSPKNVRLKPGVAETVELGQRRYRFAFTQMGQLDADPNEPQAPTGDFVLLSVDRIQ